MYGHSNTFAGATKRLVRHGLSGMAFGFVTAVSQWESCRVGLIYSIKKELSVVKYCLISVYYLFCLTNKVITKDARMSSHCKYLQYSTLSRHVPWRLLIDCTHFLCNGFRKHHTSQNDAVPHTASALLCCHSCANLSNYLTTCISWE